VSSGNYPAVTATTDANTDRTAMWTIELRKSTSTDVAPTARFTSSCVGLSCSFDGSGSSDSDGNVVGYAWDFGDSHSGTGVSPTHAYGNAGTYTVSLTVTDDGGLTDTVTHTVLVSSGAGIAFVQANNAGGGNTTTKSVNVPGTASAGNTALLFLTQTTAASWSGPSGVTGWTSVGTYANGSLTTTVWSKALVAGDPGSAVKFTSATASHASLEVAVYSGVAASNPIARTANALDTSASSHTAPAINAAAGDWVVSFWGDRSATTRSWTVPSSVAQRDASTDVASGGLTVQAVVADSGGSVSSGNYPAVTATTDANTDRTAMWTIELKAA
jgi:PKD repeat protein